MIGGRRCNGRRSCDGKKRVRWEADDMMGKRRCNGREKV